MPTLSIGRLSPPLALSSSPAAAKSLSAMSQQSSASAPYPAPPPREGMLLHVFLGVEWKESARCFLPIDPSLFFPSYRWL